jgi:hypothetical protein
VCPPALPRNAVVTEPDLLGYRVRTEVINMPVGTTGQLKMVREPGAEATGLSESGTGVCTKLLFGRFNQSFAF